MDSIIRFRTEDGSEVFAAVSEDASGLRRVSKPGELAGEAQQTFESAFRRLGPTAIAVVDSFRKQAGAPSSVTVKMNIELSAEFGAIIAKGSATSNFEVTLEWQE